MTNLTTAQKKSILEAHGFICGPRDPRLNTDHAGTFMAVEGHDDGELPTKDGSNGPWCVVGDDLDALVEEAFDFASGMTIDVDAFLAEHLVSSATPSPGM